MKTVTYAQVRNLAADMAGVPRNKLPTSEATMLRAFFAAELPDLWGREAWPELCDHLEAVTLDATKCFDTREGDANEMGDILAVVMGGDPRTMAAVTVLPRHQYARLDDRVNVMSGEEGAVWVDWQTPCPDLMASGYDTEATLLALTLPRRFYLPLAMRGAALLVSEEDPLKAAALRSGADVELAKQTQRIGGKPWWRA
jgi:hypothetical protein